MTTHALLALAEHGNRWGGGGGGGWGWIAWTLVLAAIVTLAIYLSRRRANLEPRRAAEAVIARRFAAGEIEEDEYRSRRAALRDKL